MWLQTQIFDTNICSKYLRRMFRNADTRNFVISANANAPGAS